MEHPGYGQETTAGHGRVDRRDAKQDAGFASTGAGEGNQARVDPAEAANTTFMAVFLLLSG